MINVFEPQLGPEELEAVRQVFDSKWIGKGKKTDEFEQAFADHLGVDAKYLVSVNSCTEGMFQVIKWLSYGRWGQRIVLPTISFVGTLQAILNTDMKPEFCDVDRHTLSATSDTVEHAILSGMKGLILLHYGGVPCNGLDFSNYFWIVEDAACSHYHTFGDESYGILEETSISIWSFDAMKLMTCGDGGMICCSHPSFADDLRQSINLGLDKSSGMQSSDNRWWEFEIETTGNRSITNDIASAIGIEQLKKLPQFIARRKQIWELYNELLSDLPIRLPPEIPANVKSSYYFYWIQLDNRDDLAHYLRANDVYTTFKYWPLHLAYKTGDSLPNAEWAAEHTLNLPLHPGLTDSDVSRICELIKKWIK